MDKQKNIASICGKLIGTLTAFLVCAAFSFSDTSISTHNTASLWKQIYFEDNTRFSKWQGVITQMKQGINLVNTCANTDCSALNNALQALKNAEQPEEITTYLDMVNRTINNVPYHTDHTAWGEEDYWATPQEFFHKGGDCEDFAFAKYTALKSAGIDANAMRLLFVQDMKKHIAHAVLLVTINGQEYMLDNQSATLIPGEAAHYQPIYALGENGWWLYTRS